jgi:hypothetical protein
MTVNKVLLSIAVLTLAFTGACGDDDCNCDPTGPQQGYRNLQDRSDVLHNFQLAYNERNLTRYEELLDASFIFYLSDAEVGGSLPQQWERNEEVLIHDRLFSANGIPPYPHTESVQMDLDFEDGVAWEDTIPGSAPGETWQMTTVFYDLVVEVEPDTKYISFAGATVQIIIRNAGTSQTPRWQMVILRDLGAANHALGRVAFTEESTLGGFKALYRN